jgi:tryptophan synthase alpha subunit
MSRLGLAIKERNEAGYLVLIPCVIPGFPDVETSLEATRFLDRADAVTCLEFTLPASGSFSETANQTIVDSNQQAVRANPGNEIEAWMRTSTPGFVMFYRESVDREGFESLLDRFSGYCSGVLLEWEVPDPAPYWATCNRYGMELLPIVVPQMTDKEVDEAVRFILPDGLVYFECSPQAGGERSTTQEIAARIRAIKSQRRDAVVIASMGIRSPDDVREMATIPGVNAIVVGTAFFEATKLGVPAVRRYLASIEPALGIPSSRVREIEGS